MIKEDVINPSIFFSNTKLMLRRYPNSLIGFTALSICLPAKLFTSDRIFSSSFTSITSAHPIPTPCMYHLPLPHQPLVKISSIIYQYPLAIKYTQELACLYLYLHSRLPFATTLIPPRACCDFKILSWMGYCALQVSPSRSALHSD